MEIKKTLSIGDEEPRTYHKLTISRSLYTLKTKNFLSEQFSESLSPGSNALYIHNLCVTVGKIK